MYMYIIVLLKKYNVITFISLNVTTLYLQSKISFDECCYVMLLSSQFKKTLTKEK